jgi:Tfp pilus assembly protein PilF
MASLKEKPFDVATLANASLCHLKARAFGDAAEFATRALHVDPHCAKARSRKATALRGLGHLDAALSEVGEKMKKKETNDEPKV